jgi:hypothetical protein
MLKRSFPSFVPQALKDRLQALPFHQAALPAAEQAAVLVSNPDYP